MSKKQISWFDIQIELRTRIYKTASFLYARDKTLEAIKTYEPPLETRLIFNDFKEYPFVEMLQNHYKKYELPTWRDTPITSMIRCYHCNRPLFHDPVTLQKSRGKAIQCFKCKFKD